MKIFKFFFLILLFTFSGKAIANTSFVWTERHPVLYEFISNNSNYFSRNKDNLFERYLEHKPYLIKKAKEIGVPTSLIYLPAVESGYRSDAISYSGATGMWQFMLPTSKDVGLIVNDNIDERKDWKKSTEAALKYLKWMADNFFWGDYELAILAYNAGLGRVSRAIEKYNTRDPWFLITKTSDFNKEQREYLPRYLTFVSLFSNMEKEIQK